MKKYTQVICCIGEAYNLHYVPMINIYGDISLNKTQCYSFIDELLFIKSIVNDEIIEYFVPPLIKFLLFKHSFCWSGLNLYFRYKFMLISNFVL